MFMLYIVLCLLLFFALPCAIKWKKDENGNFIYLNYLSKENTLPIKGFFVATVLFTHSKGYISLGNNLMDNLFVRTCNFLGQLIVVMFLFYSGYGIYESYKKKGKDYARKFFKSRLIPTWINFAICILLFLILNVLIGNHYSLLDIVLSFFGWSSIGNSNWFMFVTFALYILFFISFMIPVKGDKLAKLLIFTFLSFILLIVLYYTKETWWWNTIPCFTVGMWYSYFKDEIDAIVSKNNINYVLSLTTLLILFMLSFLLQRKWSIFFCLYAVFFALLVVFGTMKVKFNSKPCSFLGKHVFSIYMLQRLVFILFEYLGINNKWVFVILSYSCVIIVAVIYDYLFGKIRNLLFKRDKNMV